MYTILGSDQKEYGPVDEATVVEWIQSGRANAQTMIQKQGASDWQPISSFPEFAGVLGGGAAPMGAAAGMHYAQPGAGALAFLGVMSMIKSQFGIDFG